VIAQRIAFDHARSLQKEAAERTESGLRRALLSEIDENIAALENKSFRVTLSRSEWERARSLPFTREVFETLASAYRLADFYNANNAALSARFARSETGMIPMSGGSPPDPQPVQEAFVRARGVLAPAG
jgi:hypothetical protein